MIFSTIVTTSSCFCILHDWGIADVHAHCFSYCKLSYGFTGFILETLKSIIGNASQRDSGLFFGVDVDAVENKMPSFLLIESSFSSTTRESISYLYLKCYNVPG